MMSYVKNPVARVAPSLGGVVGSCARDSDLFGADQLTAALMSQLRLTGSGIDRFHCQQQQLLSFCCVPTRCYRYLENPIRSADHGDAVRVICSNQECAVGCWMHADCFRDWEQLMMACVRSCEAGGGSGRKEASNRRQGLELALRACVCICGKGYVRKDVSYYEPRGFGSATTTTTSEGQTKYQLRHHHHHPHPRLPLGWRPQDRQQDCCRQVPPSLSYDADQAAAFSGVRPRTFSFSSTGSSPASSTATPPPAPASPRRSDGRSPRSIASRSPTPTAPEVTTSHQQTTAAMTLASGNIFRHRCDLSAFRVLPVTVRNSYHIKVDDDGPHGNDKVRSFLLTTLTRKGIRRVHCAVCSADLPIYDEFPLIDGTFFLSPRGDYTDDHLSVVFERRLVYLNAVCLGCLDGSRTRLLCRGCLSPWDGSSLVLGTMYSYDVFGAMSCCRSRLTCTGCGLAIQDDPQNLRFFSEFSRLTICPHCQTEDYHFLKPLNDIFLFQTPK